MPGNTESIKSVNFQEVIVRRVMPPVIIIICLINSARVLVRVSCRREISEEILLFSSPTLCFSKNVIGSFIRWLYVVCRSSARTFLSH